MSVLVTGGFGYIGSHTCVELLNAGYEVVIVDNLKNSYRMVQQRIQEITGKKVRFYEVDLLDYHALERVFETEDIETVIHFAGLKSVPESMKHPLMYYRNVAVTLNLCKVMEQFQVKRLIFSSTAAVYGHAADSPLEETSEIEPASPYGETKLLLEHMFESTCRADTGWKIIILRYFNPIGAHPSARLGELPRREADNLLPQIMKVAAGEESHVNIYGTDYDTCDGSCVRDYVHVSDLARGHVKALEHLEQTTACTIYNLGTGRGYSVFQVLEVFREISGKDIPYKICSRRQGDVPVSFCHPQKAKEELGWMAGYGIEAMCRDAWNWKKNLPLSEELM